MRGDKPALKYSFAKMIADSPRPETLARANDGATAMRNYGITQIQSTARIVMICPSCGQENSEFAETLRGMRFYACSGEGCDYSFAIAGPGARAALSLTEACKKFYAAFYAMRGQGAR
jgi:hypothetical protein